MKTDNPVIIFGAEHLGLAAKELMESNGRVVYGFLDDNKSLHGSEVGGIKVLGSTDDDGFLKLIDKKCDAFIAIDDTRLRKSITSMLREQRHVVPINGIHRLAMLSPDVQMGHGNFIDAGVLIGAGVQLGHHDLLHLHATIGPAVKIGDYVQLGAGAILNSQVVVEDDAFIGSGAVIVSGVTIGKGAQVGAGSVVIGSVKKGEMVFGNPAGAVKR